MGRFLTITYIWARRCVVAIIGGTVVAIGVLMIVLPGPAFVVIPAGLAILGLEFAFARRWLRRLRTTSTQVFSTTFARFFRKRSDSHYSDSHYVRMPGRFADRAHASPPFAPGQLAFQRPTLKASTKRGYYRPL